ncbi:methylmalonyl-CoA mutase family protein [Xanthomonas translucens]|uniref:Fused isobutyryl-CoA mutase n=1 Tax=Xanthomonas translucens pv. translucens DSM 18974 TaxID=1261556 RepID=A0A1C3TQL2_XANCT|nr:methylmalonyl-CoA mutase family protein [Xanthomonas translucens]KTF38545.1 methylmalonyl-CoA mutase [Xanthomonas translucens pv. translucens]KWV15904.1 methylmalonyl-CoA mutase [Xanthomonas translucens]MCC8445040.1 methylmalonyl-CoA mutase family protein [Xanthomonas translucens pv. translucens]MCS3359924.1 methylmalonyl-CoA mutase family protein [Xanthomonas translucens pv. translucens]MCS3372321.1 methylmalonyl-CoA mutase family protein [Xanthomonas translucens pv. translucens]
MSIPASRVPLPQADTSPLRFVTAASLFDGHDAAINIMRRLIQAQGAEVIHLGHNRSVEDVVRAALQEDADAIALSSYQGGHVEYFKYMVDMLRERGAGHVRVFGGGGGTITPEEIAELQAYGVERIYHPNDGMKMGLVEMIEDVLARASRGRDPGLWTRDPEQAGALLPHIDDEIGIGRVLSALEDGAFSETDLVLLRKQWQCGLPGTAESRVPGPESRTRRTAPVLGLTGTGGAGKSSVTDELLNRFLAGFPQMRIAVVSVDPSRRRTGGALLGDRIRMNALRSPRVYMRSMATRRQHAATNRVLKDCIALLKGIGYDLVIVETAGIGQSDSEIVDLVDFPVYVMTSDYGAPSQLEKIDMLDFAELVVLNKYDRRGAEDALRDVRKQWRRNRAAFQLEDDAVPVYPTIASQFNDPGISWMFVNLCRLLRAKLGLAASDPRAETTDAARCAAPSPHCDFLPQLDTTLKEPRATVLIPGARVRYLAEIAEQGRALNAGIERQAEAADRAKSFWQSLHALQDPQLPTQLELYPVEDLQPSARAAAVDASLLRLRQRYNDALQTLSSESLKLLRAWPQRLKSITDEVTEYAVRGKTIRVENYRQSLSHQPIPKIAAPRYKSWGELLRFLGKENLPGSYPYTGGVYPYRRAGEDPIRMFAGEGTPERTNRRFHYLSVGQPAARLSTAFDSVTLYGEDPAPRPDIYGKIGNSGVNIPTLDDMKKLYSGFDLCAPTTSVSMTINGPAPMILAMFMNTAIDQQVEKYLKADAQRWAQAEQALDALFEGRQRPRYHGALPPSNDGLGLALLGVSGDQLVDAPTYAQIKAQTLSSVRGTVQADILKEDQAQNTCIFSTEFALRMMGDIQQYFVEHKVRNFYSVSISGYHIAEAGANPISQLAFTLSNGFTIVEYYLARGMRIDDFAPNLSFFFSNGMDPEYTAIGRVARRIWARAMRERYGGNERSQMMKYHIQTSGRSLHAQEIQFNDIRTTLQALYALFDNCNSLHTNAYDEAITTPTEESVRRAVAIQMIINKELGLNFCENPWQGSFIVEQLTDLVEEAVYKEFEAISERGGVLGAMDSMYQRGKIQEESLYYEHKKHDGSLPLVGVNTFLPKQHVGETATQIELIRSTEEEKGQQIANVDDWQQRRNGIVPSPPEQAEASGLPAPGDAVGLGYLQRAARERRNVFAALMQAVKTHSLGQISHALYAVGGEYRRNM